MKVENIHQNTGLVQNDTFFSVFWRSFRCEMLTGAEIRKRFPQWTVGDDVIGVYVPEGGFVDAALANSTHVQLARGYGASVLEECPVQKIEPTQDGQVIVSSNLIILFA